MRTAIALLLSLGSLAAGENLIPKGGDASDCFAVISEGKGALELNIASGQTGAELVYAGSHNNITLARYAPGGKAAETLAAEGSLAFHLEGAGSVGIFVRSTKDNAYLLLLTRSNDGRGLLRLFKRPETSKADFLKNVSGSKAFEWAQDAAGERLQFQVTNQSDGSVTIHAEVTDAAGQLLTEIEKNDFQEPLRKAGDIALRFYAPGPSLTTIRISEFSFSPLQ
jgi:hypothetical protein